MKNKKRKISIIGGTGALGSGLAVRLALAGHSIVIGSREQDRAKTSADDLRSNFGAKLEVAGMTNSQAADAGDIIFLTVPYLNHQLTLEDIRSQLHGKILVDTTVPLAPPKVRTVHLPEEGAVAKHSQTYLGNDTKVVSAFQNVAATHLADPEKRIDCDVLVCGNDKEARSIVIELAKDIGMHALHAGRIENSVVAESLTSALIFINARYKADGAGIRITGITD